MTLGFLEELRILTLFCPVGSHLITLGIFFTRIRLEVSDISHLNPLVQSHLMTLMVFTYGKIYILHQKNTKLAVKA